MGTDSSGTIATKQNIFQRTISQAKSDISSGWSNFLNNIGYSNDDASRQRKQTNLNAVKTHPIEFSLSMIAQAANNTLDTAGFSTHRWDTYVDSSGGFSMSSTQTRSFTEVGVNMAMMLPVGGLGFADDAARATGLMRTSSNTRRTLQVVDAPKLLPAPRNVGNSLPEVSKYVFRNDPPVRGGVRPLPEAPNRIWYEADINYNGGYRGNQRLLYSNDGLIYYTPEHYKSFQMLGNKSR